MSRRFQRHQVTHSVFDVYIMSENQYLHHAEQMEAARKEFALFWKNERDYLVNQGLEEREIIYAQNSCWKAFLTAKGLRK